QEPSEVVEKAGLSSEETDTGLFGMITTFEITPEGGDDR
ncbi:methyltransferase type 11, partial [Halorubrum ezzemoulense]